MPRDRHSKSLVAGVCMLAACTATFAQESRVQAALSAGNEHRQPIQPAGSAVAPVPEGFESMTLAPGFLLQMDVYGVPEMSGQLRVDAPGNVAIPLVGAVHVATLTVTEAQDTIAKALIMREILRDPQVTLNILQYPARNVSVVGEVQMPGRIHLLHPRPLRDVLALAGGVTTEAGSTIDIERPDSDGAIKTIHVHSAQEDQKTQHETLVEPGDTVVVHRVGIVYVLGAVNRPGGYLMVNRGSLNVVQAISLAGGETLQAARNRAMIVRRKADRIDQIKVPLRKMETGEAAPAELQPDDALYIPPSGWKSIMMNGSSVLSSAAGASIYAASNRP